MHERIERMPSLLPNAHRAVMRQLNCHASLISEPPVLDEIAQSETGHLGS